MWDQKWKRERERDGDVRGDMRKTTHGWTVVHSLLCIEVTFPTSHAERSPLNCFAPSNTDDGEDIERGGGGGETSVSVGSEMEKRERRRRHEEDNTRMDSSTLTESHIGDHPDIPCREVSVELFRIIKH